MSKLPADLQKPLELAGQAFLSFSRAIRPDEDEADQDTAGEADEMDAAAALTEAAGLSYLGISQIGALFSVPEGHRGPRGPYNQFSKSEDFFRVSMSWPPRWFRAQYR